MNTTGNNAGRATSHAAWGGIILSMLGIQWHDVLQTLVLAVLGTTASFCTSALLKKLRKGHKKA